MTYIRLGSVKRLGGMADVLCAKEGTKRQAIQEITRGNETSHGTQTEIGLLSKEGGDGRKLGYGIAMVVAVLFHEYH